MFTMFPPTVLSFTVVAFNTPWGEVNSFVFVLIIKTFCLKVKMHHFNKLKYEKTQNNKYFNKIVQTTSCLSH